MRRQPKARPEKIPLPPESATTPSSHQSKTPFFIEVEQIKQGQFLAADRQLEQLRKERIKKLQQQRESKLVAYYSLGGLTASDAEHFYEVLATAGNIDNLDLLLVSPGGLSDPAFKMGRLCQDCARGRFSVLIPYYAKSAATMLALAADEIVMGTASELGPIDPQVQRSNEQDLVPAHALRDSLQYLEDRISSDPNLASLYWPLIQSMDLMSLGHYDREIEGAEQYAEHLLGQRMFKDDNDHAKQVAERLARGYKRHNYVIDREEARSELGLKIVDATPDEWDLIWQLHNLYDRLLRDSLPDRFKVIETLEATFQLGR